MLALDSTLLRVLGYSGRWMFNAQQLREALQLHLTGPRHLLVRFERMNSEHTFCNNSFKFDRIVKCASNQLVCKPSLTSPPPAAAAGDANARAQKR